MELKTLRGLDLNLPAIIDFFGKGKVIGAIGRKDVLATILRQ